MEKFGRLYKIRKGVDMDFPLEKYKFYVNGNQVIAVSSFAGRTVKGTAHCADEDNFNLEIGKEIAAARCNLKISEKRYQRAVKRFNEAYNKLIAAEEFLQKMIDYSEDAGIGVMKARAELGELLKKY